MLSCPQSHLSLLQPISGNHCRRGGTDFDDLNEFVGNLQTFSDGVLQFGMLQFVSGLVFFVELLQFRLTDPESSRLLP